MKRLLGWLGVATMFAALLTTGSAAQAAENSTNGNHWPVSAQRTGEKVTPQSTCNITRGASRGQYICEYGIIDITFQNRCHTFVIGTNYAVWYAWETTTSSNAPCNDTASQGGTWSNYHSLGGQARTPWGASTNGSSWIRVAVTGRSNGLTYCNQYRSSTGNWTGWHTPSCV